MEDQYQSQATEAQTVPPTTPPTDQVSPQENGSPSVSPNANETQTDIPQQRSSNKPVVIGAIVVVLLLAIVAFVFMMKKPANVSQVPQSDQYQMQNDKMTPKAEATDSGQLSSGQDNASLEADLSKLEKEEANFASDQKDVNEDLASQDNPENL